METAVLIGLGVLACGWAFNAGKREGSKKGYFVGRKKADHKKNRFAKKRTGGWA